VIARRERRDFGLSKSLTEYAAALREWSVEACRPYAREADSRHAPPNDWQKILDSAPVEFPRWDRPGQRHPDFKEGHWVRELVFEESLCYGDPWPQWVLSPGIGHLVVDAMGTDEQVERWYTPVIGGGSQTAFGLTEPHFGSDTSLVATTATRDGDHWVLNGTKMYCSLGAIAAYTVVFATTDKSAGPSAIAAFVIPAGTDGFIVAKANESKLGIRSAQTAELRFENCIIPLDHRLGWTGEGEPADKPGKGGRGGAFAALSNNRPNISAIAVGIAQASVDVAAGVLAERQPEFTPERWSVVEAEVTRMDDALDRARRLNYRAQSAADRGTSNRSLPAMAKAYAPETCERVIRRCMQLLGPEGASEEFLLEKWHRDVKILDIFEGTGQIQRLIVARGLMGAAVN
jgi:acyl-CoA dehydrogenase